MINIIEMKIILLIILFFDKKIYNSWLYIKSWFMFMLFFFPYISMLIIFIRDKISVIGCY